MQSNDNTKRRHPFKELKRMFDSGKLPLNYLFQNVKHAEMDTFIDCIHKNIQKHFPDGTMLSKKQLKVLKTDLFIVPCLDKEKIHYHSEYEGREYCSTCIVYRKRNSLMQQFAVTNDAEFECAICMETGGKFAKLDCDHKFHTNCIQTWLIQSLTCPCCRKNYE